MSESPGRRARAHASERHLSASQREARGDQDPSRFPDWQQDAGRRSQKHLPAPHGLAMPPPRRRPAPCRAFPDRDGGPPGLSGAGRCMQQDCQQSLDSLNAAGGKGNFCRFLDALGLCYDYREAQVPAHAPLLKPREVPEPHPPGLHRWSCVRLLRVAVCHPTGDSGSISETQKKITPRESTGLRAVSPKSLAAVSML